MHCPHGNDLRDRLPTAVKRAGHDRVERHESESLAQRLRLRPAALVEADAWRPAGQQLSRRRGQAVAHEQNRCHA
jgi:hypothetical protein